MLTANKVLNTDELLRDFDGDFPYLFSKSRLRVVKAID